MARMGFEDAERASALVRQLDLSRDVLQVVAKVAAPDLVVQEGDVAYLAHIGGFVFGLIAVRLFARRREPPEPPIPVY